MKRAYFDTNIFEDIVKKVIDINIDELNSFTNIAQACRGLYVKRVDAGR